MAKFHPPENFDFMRPAGWPEWRERFDRNRKASKLHKEEEDVQVSTLIYALGKEADKIVKTFTFTNAADANKYEPVLQKFNDHFVPRTKHPSRACKVLQQAPKDRRKRRTIS
ncbi:hypothetical protein RRG08_043141 [Elysia crispata]|uniref:Uncharacterized protein n=1 Tax=Elysia crispata TaxID=231223 RepID=A0AAE1D1J5_9GAST|nr:hypothetical protein RRG08_043141 [Elysia crispata]